MNETNACAEVKQLTLLERVRQHGYHVEPIVKLSAPFQDSITVVTRVRLSFGDWLRHLLGATIEIESQIGVEGMIGKHKTLRSSARMTAWKPERQ